MVRGRKLLKEESEQVCKVCGISKPLIEFKEVTNIQKIYRADGSVKIYEYKKHHAVCKECDHELNVRYRRPDTILKKLRELNDLIGDDPRLLEAHRLVLEFKSLVYKKKNNEPTQD